MKLTAKGVPKSKKDELIRIIQSHLLQKKMAKLVPSIKLTAGGNVFLFSMKLIAYRRYIASSGVRYL